jgi:hypothetical protein
MANEQNLKVLSPNEARELGHIGGVVSGQVRRERKKLRELVVSMGNNPMFFNNPLSRKHFLEEYGLENPTITEGIIAKLISSALYGDLAAIKLFLSLASTPSSQNIPPVPSMLTQQKIKVSYEAKHQEFK